MKDFIDKVKSVKQDTENLILIEKVNSDFGFFFKDGKVYFGRKANSRENSYAIKTSYLSFEPKVHIEGIKTDAEFSPGEYDLLIFNESIEDLHFESFYYICKAYANNNNGLSFYSFFRTLCDMFRRKNETFTDAIGLFGELVFIKYMYENYKINISKNWHITGSNSKFDFVFEGLNLDIKATTKQEPIFAIKQNQLMNNLNNYVGIIKLIGTGNGETINSLKSYFEHEEIFSNDIEFQIKLNNEILKIKSKDDLSGNFSLDYLKIIDCKTMHFIESVPNEITDITYHYNFNDTVDIDIEKDFVNLIK